jgi:hypothetical protein
MGRDGVLKLSAPPYAAVHNEELKSGAL